MASKQPSGSSARRRSRGLRRAGLRGLPWLVAAWLVLLGASGVPAEARTVWLCKPGMADNPCELGMGTTVRHPDRAERVTEPRRAQPRRIDCFYVYPTVSNQRSTNASRERDPELVSIAKYQAARFSLRCRVFAPVYRQRTLAALATSSEEENATAYRIAFSDVREAWRTYLRRHNRGRGVVLIGHSQGTHMLRQLIRTQIDDRPRVRRRLVSALLLGGDVTVARGRTRGGDFDHVPVCTRPGQLGCVVAYSTYARDPSSGSRFGRAEREEDDPFGFPGGPGYEVACTDPIRLSRTRGPLRALQPSDPFAPGPIAAGFMATYGGLPPSAATPWVVPPDRWRGRCRTINGANVLRYDPIRGSRRPNFFPDPSWGTHLVDVNLTLDKLVRIVRLQSAAYRRAGSR